MERARNALAWVSDERLEFERIGILSCLVDCKCWLQCKLVKLQSQ